MQDDCWSEESHKKWNEEVILCCCCYVHVYVVVHVHVLDMCTCTHHMSTLLSIHMAGNSTRIELLEYVVQVLCKCSACCYETRTVPPLSWLHQLCTVG